MIHLDFLDYSERKLKQNLTRIEVCLGKLNDDRIWIRGNANENSIGNLCLHLSGNVRQWILSGIGGEPDTRQRGTEFAAEGGLRREELVERLERTVVDACRVVGGLTPSRLQEHVTIQAYSGSVLQAVYHVVEHFSLHTGQILFATKALLGEDLGFHRHLNEDAPGRHSEPTP